MYASDREASSDPHGFVRSERRDLRPLRGICLWARRVQIRHPETKATFSEKKGSDVRTLDSREYSGPLYTLGNYSDDWPQGSGMVYCM